MLTDNIQSKVKELYEQTSDSIKGVSYGYKISSRQYTNTKSIIFLVDKKKPASELSPDEIIPPTITIDGITYKTDVHEVGNIKAISCDSNCYLWQDVAPPTQSMIRPLVGGISIGSKNTAIVQNGQYIEWFIGTLGFIAVDNDTNGLVGITNNHVVIQDAFYSTDRNIRGISENEINNPVYQDGELGPNISNKIGQVMRYNPITMTNYNQVDCAIFSLDPSVISMTSSCGIYGLTTSALPFASTQDIDNLLNDNPVLYSTGRTSGVKIGTCALLIQSIGYTGDVTGYNLQGAEQTIAYNNLISFTRLDPTCTYPIAPGDSGSVLIADYGNGIWKIIGLCFAGGDTIGLACRIDMVAQQMNISAWDGSNKVTVDTSSQSYFTITGATSSKSIFTNSKNYYQVGLTSSIISIP